MKKYFISALFIFGLAINAIVQNSSNSSAQDNLNVNNKTAVNYQASNSTANINVNTTKKTNVVVNKPKQNSTGSTSSTNQTTPTQTLPPVAPATNGKYKNGTYTGLVADASYGNVQVQAIINGGKLTDIVVLQYPNDRQHSIQVANYSLPRLKQEAIAAQSADINSISGASYTSDAYIQSLGDALSQALN